MSTHNIGFYEGLGDSKSNLNIGFYEKMTKITFQSSSNIIKYTPYLFFLSHLGLHSLPKQETKLLLVMIFIVKI